MQNQMPPIQSPDNTFHDGNPLTGELGTIVTALFMNDVQSAIRNAQAEILSVLADAGISADPAKSDQLLTALKKNYVLQTRKVNNKALSADITLSAGDVGAYTKVETDTRVTAATTAANNANDNANGRVPSARKVNGKSLTADITLSAGDVGAYTKAETNNALDAKLNVSRVQSGPIDATANSVMINNAWGLGASPLVSDNMGSPQVGSADDAVRAGFISPPGSVAVNYFDAYMPMVTSSRSGGDGSGQVMQLQVSGTGNLGYRSRNNNVWSTWSTAVNIESSQTITGAKIFGQSLIVRPAASGGIEVGSITTAAQSFIDFHSSGNNIDYDARILSTGGNTGLGGAVLNVIAASFTWNGYNVATLQREEIFTGLKTFSIKPIVSSQYPGISLDATAISAGALGRVLEIEYEGAPSVAFMRRTTRNVTAGQQRIIIPFPTGTAAANLSVLVQNVNAVADSNGLWKTPESAELTPAAIGALSVGEFAGIPLPFPGAVAPAGFLKCNGQAFNKTAYPILAARYPTGYLPDLRSEFIRGADDGRGVDAGRVLLSAQGDAIRNITGKFANNGLAWGEGVSSSVGEGAFTRLEGYIPSNNNLGNVGCQYTFDASKVVPTANENRPRNIAFNYIVRAA